MADDEHDPRELRKAFDEALRLFRDWSADLPDARSVRIGDEWFSIRVVCGLMTGFTDKVLDKMPDEVLDELEPHMHAKHQGIRGDLYRDRTYATGARCLLELMDDLERQRKARQNR